MAEEKDEKIIPEEIKSILRSFYQPGFTAIIRKGGTVSYAKAAETPRKLPRFTVEQLDDAARRIVAGESKISVASSLGIGCYQTLNNWLRKRTEEPEIWARFPSAPVAAPLAPAPDPVVVPPAPSPGSVRAQVALCLRDTPDDYVINWVQTGLDASAACAWFASQGLATVVPERTLSYRMVKRLREAPVQTGFTFYVAPDTIQRMDWGDVCGALTQVKDGRMRSAAYGKRTVWKADQPHVWVFSPVLPPDGGTPHRPS